MKLGVQVAPKYSINYLVKYSNLSYTCIFMTTTLLASPALHSVYLCQGKPEAALAALDQAVSSNFAVSSLQPSFKCCSQGPGK